MSDYTPDEEYQLANFPRLKAERDELLEMLVYLLKYPTVLSEKMANKLIERIDRG